jgi:hypothetical protein
MTSIEPVFDLSAAKQLLRADVKDGEHLTMKPLQLHMTREEHKPYSAGVLSRDSPCQVHKLPRAEACSRLKVENSLRILHRYCRRIVVGLV